MKITLKIISLLCACFMMLSIFSACETKDNDDPSNTSDSEAVSGTEQEAPAVEKKSYGKDFTSLTLPDMFPDDYFFTNENTYDDMTDSVFQRMSSVNEYLGVNIINESYADFTTYSSMIENQVRAGDDTYQIGLTHVYQGLYGLVTSDKLLDFEKHEQIQLDRDYWNYDLMEELRLNDGLYLGYSEFNLATTYVIMYNKSLYDDYKASAYDGESIYDIVLDNKWTLDKLISMASVCTGDLDGDSSYTAKDKYGFAGLFWVDACNFMQSSNINILTRNESGDFTLSCVEDKTTLEKLENVADKIKTLYDANYTYLWEHSVAEEDKLKFSDGNALFFMQSTMRLKGHAGEDVKFGVIPYPMYDEEQGKTAGYRQLNWGGFMVIPAVTSNESDYVGDTIEMLAYYSGPVTISFYETLLGAKVADAPEDAKMLRLIWDSICSDPGLTYESVNRSSLDPYVYIIPQSILGEVTISGFSSSRLRPALRGIKDLNEFT